MAVYSRTKRIVTIRISSCVSAQGYYVGIDRQGLTMVDVYGKIYHGKPVVSAMAAAA